MNFDKPHLYQTFINNSLAIQNKLSKSILSEETDSPVLLHSLIIRVCNPFDSDSKEEDQAVYPLESIQDKEPQSITEETPKEVEEILEQLQDPSFDMDKTSKLIPEPENFNGN